MKGAPVHRPRSGKPLANSQPETPAAASTARSTVSMAVNGSLLLRPTALAVRRRSATSFHSADFPQVNTQSPCEPMIDLRMSAAPKLPSPFRLQNRKYLHSHDRVSS